MQSTFLPLASTILQVENRRRYLIEDFHADSAILIPLLLMPRDKVRPWTWNASRELAAQLVADKQLTNFEIARRAGVSDSQLNRWKLAPEFASRVTEHVATFRASITTTGLARRENRIAAKKARAAALRRVIRQRAEAYGHGEPQYNPVTGVPLLDKKTNAPIVVPIPGGDTGMVVRQPRTAGVQFSVDGVLLARLSALEGTDRHRDGRWENEVSGRSCRRAVDGGYSARSAAAASAPGRAGCRRGESGSEGCRTGG